MSDKSPNELNKGIPPPSIATKPDGIMAWLFWRVFIPLILLLLGLFTIWRMVVGRQVGNQIAKIRAAGLPMSGEELNDWLPAVRDSQNGAVVMAHAFDLLRMFPDKRSNQVDRVSLDARTNSWPLATVTLVDDYVQMNAPALAKAGEALTLTASRYPVDYSFGLGATLPHVSKLRALARAAAMRAERSAEQGRANEWTQDVEFDLRLASTLDNEPVFLSHLVRDTILSMAGDATQRCLQYGTPAEEELKKLEAAFEKAGNTNTLPLAFIGERAMMAPMFRMNVSEIPNGGQDGENGSQPAAPRSYASKRSGFVWFTGFFERDLNFFLDTMDQGLEAVGRPLPEALATTKRLDSAAKVALKKYYLLSSILLPSFHSIVAKDANTSAHINLAITALAVERFKLARGRLPENLTELAPEFLEKVPSDPFDGAPLRFHHLPRGYVIYSIGADGHDDDGREPPEHRKSDDNTSYDITFIVETP